MPSYSDAEMKAIMARALQIDSSRSDRFTPEQLRAIAAELGISSQALEVAMYEADARPLNVAPMAAGRRNTLARNLAIAAGVLLVVAAGFIGLSRRVMPHRDRFGYAAPARATTKIGTPTRATEATPTPEAQSATRKTAPTKAVPKATTVPPQ
jgi:hypothetical protein